MEREGFEEISMKKGDFVAWKFNEIFEFRIPAAL